MSRSKMIEDYIAIENQRARLIVAEVKQPNAIIREALRISQEYGWDPVKVVTQHVDSVLNKTPIEPPEWQAAPEKKWWQFWRRSD